MRTCFIFLSLVVASCLAAGCGPPASAPQPVTTAREPAPAASPAPSGVNHDDRRTASTEPASGPLSFDEVSAPFGIQFQHFSPLTPERHVHLFLGSGIGWLDWDRDGWADLYCGQGAAYAPGGETVDAPPRDALLRNLAGRAFADVSALAGLDDPGYTMGVAAADYNHDGFVDLCVTGFGANVLLCNQGDGCFSPLPFPLDDLPGRLSAGCAWGDIDADGHLDLFISNYAQLDPASYPTCKHTLGGVTIPISCHPANLPAIFDQLLRNRGDGTFEDISVAAGLQVGTPRCGLGVLAADLDFDGDIDFYVANDTTPNHLWENVGNKAFVDRGDDSGTARNRHGATEAGMGVVAGDFTGSGRIDLFVTNYYGETNTLYRSEGRLQFADVTDEIGLGAPSRWRLGFGTSLADFDNDTQLDLIVVNGHVQDRLSEIRRDEPFAQLPLLFHNDGGRFRDVTAGAGEYFRQPHVGRSTAGADFDRDGDVDLAVNSLNEPVALLQNDSTQGTNWLRVELIGRFSNRSGIGARLEVHAGDRLLVRCVHGGTGYLSSDDTAILIGLGEHSDKLDVTVSWPGGWSERWTELEPNRSWQLVEGTGMNGGEEW